MLKEDNKELAAALQDKRSSSRLTIGQLLDDAERVIMEAKGMNKLPMQPLSCTCRTYVKSDNIMHVRLPSIRLSLYYNACHRPDSPLFCVFVPFFSEEETRTDFGQAAIVF